MKRLVVINLILISLIYIIPFKKDVDCIEISEEIVTEDIIESSNIIENTEVISRSLEEERQQVIEQVEEPKINLEISVDSDLRVLSNLTSEDYNKMLADTNLAGLGDSLVQVEKEHQINGLYILGLACLESNYGKSNYAKTRNNLVGWNAVDSNPDKASYFSSKDECILFVAYKLKTNYLTEGGCYFKGYTPKSIDINYCTDKNHASKIIKIINKLVNKI